MSHPTKKTYEIDDLDGEIVTIDRDFEEKTRALFEDVKAPPIQKNAPPRKRSRKGRRRGR